MESNWIKMISWIARIKKWTNIIACNDDGMQFNKVIPPSLILHLNQISPCCCHRHQSILNTDTRPYSGCCDVDTPFIIPWKYIWILLMVVTAMEYLIKLAVWLLFIYLSAPSRWCDESFIMSGYQTSSYSHRPSAESPALFATLSNTLCRYHLDIYNM